MPVPGPAPKPNTQRRRRNTPVVDWVDVPEVPFTEGPDLPETAPNGSGWGPWVLRWWQEVRSMPHCRLWSGSDWEFAFDTAALKHAFATKSTATLAAEIRNRERVLGTTADYRRALRIRYIPAQTATATADVTNLDDYRDL